MEGLEKFREYFADFSDNYVIIGGTAFNLCMEELSSKARSTRDIDLIVIVEKMTPAFGTRFWMFVKEGEYQPSKRKHGEDEGTKYELYRFVTEKEGYPQMIELLSRFCELPGMPEDIRIEPIPMDEDVSSLSAIVLDDVYYEYTIAHSKINNEIRHADIQALIALKTHAYLNLLEERANGREVNTKDIKKHRNDVLKCMLELTEDEIIVPQAIKYRIDKFANYINSNWDEQEPQLKDALNHDSATIKLVLQRMTEIFINQ